MFSDLIYRIKKVFKVSLTKTIIAVCTAAIFPQIAVLITVGVLVGVDLITGIYKAYKCKEEITSRKMSLTISKFLLYNLCVLTGAFVQMYIMPIVPVVSLIGSAIAMIELTSIAENTTKILGYNIFKKFFDYIKREQKKEGE